MCTWPLQFKIRRFCHGGSIVSLFADRWQIEMVAAFANVKLNKVPRMADIEHEV